MPKEISALDVRYMKAKDEARTRGVQIQAASFEQALDASEAVLCRPFRDLSTLAFSEHEIYSTFYQRVNAGIRIPDGDKWDRLRGAADTHLFGENKVHIRFAALSLDGYGLDRYGECSLALRADMIAHRASLIEENSVVFMKNHDVSAKDDYAIPHGYRAIWSTRAKLALAKLTSFIHNSTTAADFPRLLTNVGVDGWHDKFVEVHIWGPLSIRSIRQVSIQRWRYKPRKGELAAFRDRLASLGVAFRVP